MSELDQRSIDNQPSAWVTAAAAARRLDVRLRTVYAYASRGLLRRAPAGAGRRSLYLEEDVERLRARHLARAGHGAVAAGALRWGEPVLDSALTRIDDDGPHYRGRSAISLARDGASFESVAELLWVGTLPEAPPMFAWLGRAPRRPGRVGTPLMALLVETARRAAEAPSSLLLSPDALRSRARALVRLLGASLALGREPRAFEPALREPTIAAAAATALGARPRPGAVRLIEEVLVVLADHELNPSAFTARVAASAGAALEACIAAALATASGPLHATSCERTETLVTGAQARGAGPFVRERLRRGEPFPGFGHPLYPKGDPRARWLLRRAEQVGRSRRAVSAVLRLVDAARAAGLGEPNVDAGIVAVVRALDLHPSAGSGLFALGRAAGWVAHALEQASAGFVLRPRARYVGPTRDEEGPIS